MAKCPYCSDLGIVRRKGDFTGKTYPCPAKCDAAKERAHERLSKSMSTMFKYHTGLSLMAKHLEGLTLDDFMVDGKRLATTLVNFWSQPIENPFSEYEAARMAGLPLESRDHSEKNSILMVGPPGTGKTTLAALAAMRVIGFGRQCLMVRVDELYGRIKDTFNTQSEYIESEIINTVSQVPFLVLDELSVQKVSDYMRGIMERIIDYRVSNDLRTIYTTNWDESTMQAQWGDRIALRIMTAHMVIVDGEVYRRKSGYMKD